MRTSLLTTGMLGLLIALLLSSCGTQNVGNLDPSGINSTRGIAGVKLGDFEVIRYNTHGLADPALNTTLNLAYANGDSNALLINVSDAEFTTSVCVDVIYNAGSVHPVRAEFNHLLGGEGEAINAAILDPAGVAGLGEVAVHDFIPGALNGAFATVYFADGPNRAVSVAGAPHHLAEGIDRTLGGDPNIVVANADPATDQKITWYAGWHKGDGDQNSEVNISDLTPMGTYFHQKPFAGDSTWRGICADYNVPAAVTPLSEVAIDDITEIGVYYGEKTNDYLVQVSDNVDGAGTTDVTTRVWDPVAVNPIQAGTTAVVNDLSTVFLSWSVDFVTETFTGVDLNAIDTAGNGDKIVRVFITPRVTSPAASGLTVHRDLNIGAPVVPKDAIIIKDLDIMVAGATGGVGGNVFNASNLNAQVVANLTPVTFSLNTISGSYTPNGGVATDFAGLNLDAGTYPNFAANYAKAMTAAVAAMAWDTVTGPGDLGFRRTGEWYDDPTDTIFPDDDPDSVAANPEGHLNATLAKTGTTAIFEDTGVKVTVLPDDNNDIVLPVGFDVTPDANAATFSDYLLNGDADDTLIPKAGQPDLVINLDWGGADPTAIDLLTTQLQMLVLPATKICVPGDASTIDFAYEDFVATPQDPAPILDPGEFTVQNHGGDWQIHAIMPILRLLDVTDYIFRFNNTLVWTSVNRPDWTFRTGPPPEVAPLVSIPEAFGSGPEYNYLQIYMEDSIVHRWSSAEPNGLTGSINYKGHDADFNDVLKTSGTEFPLEVVVGDMWPKMQIVLGDIDGLTIVADDPNDIGSALYNLFRREYGRMVVDVTSVPRPTQIADPTWTYTYALFRRDGTQIGWETFTTNLVPPTWSPVSATKTECGWGVNAWNREAGDYSPPAFPHFDSTTIDGNTIATAAPDVLWFEWNGGYVNDWDSGIDETDDTNNVKILLDDQTMPGSKYATINLRIVGIVGNGNYLGIHAVNNFDYANKWAPGDPSYGVLESGHEYTLTLDDASGSGMTDLFTGTLTCINANPNG